MALKSGRDGVRKDQVDKEGKIKKSNSSYYADIAGISENNGINLLYSGNSYIVVQSGTTLNTITLAEGVDVRDYQTLIVIFRPCIYSSGGYSLSSYNSNLVISDIEMAGENTGSVHVGYINNTIPNYEDMEFIQVCMAFEDASVLSEGNKIQLHTSIITNLTLNSGEYPAIILNAIYGIK